MVRNESNWPYNWSEINDNLVDSMPTKDTYVIIFSDLKKMWTTLKKSIMSKIGGLDGTLRWKCIIAGFCYRRYSFNRWYTRIHNNFLANFFNSIIAILRQYLLIMQILFFAFFSGTGNCEKCGRLNSDSFRDIYVHFLLNLSTRNSCWIR